MRRAPLALLSTISLSCIVAADPPPRPPSAPRTPLVRVATWNVHDLFDAEDRLVAPGELDGVPTPAEVDEKLARVAAVLRRLDADVVLLQEVESRAVLDALAARAGYPHARLVEGGDPRGIDVAALSRAPVLAYVSHLGERGGDGRPLWPRDCVEVHVDLGGARLVVVASHLSSALSDDGTRRRAQAARLREIADAARAAGALVVAGGDLNDVAGSEALAPLLADGAWLDLAGDLPPDRAWTWAGGGRRAALDHLLLPRAAASAVVAADVLSGDDVAAASDHRPVRVDLLPDGGGFQGARAGPTLTPEVDMADGTRGDEVGITPGLAGGPGPTPPGVGDNTPGTAPPLEGLPPREAQQEEGEAAERSAGTRRADVEEGRRSGEPEAP